MLVPDNGWECHVFALSFPGKPPALIFFKKQPSSGNPGIGLHIARPM
jgi:hypothetical protein